MRGAVDSSAGVCELDFLRVRTWCAGWAPEWPVRRQQAVYAEMAARVVTLHRRTAKGPEGSVRREPPVRPTWSEDGGWALLRYDRISRQFRPYRSRPWPDLDDVLTEIDRDPCGVFLRRRPR